jgi:arsenate reductase
MCIGNACRSQMAEGFARAYGSDVLAPVSAGLTPAMAVPPDTIRAMGEKNIDIRRHFPKSWRHVMTMDFDLVVNLSGCDLPAGINAPERVWKVADPYLSDFSQYCKVRDQIENLVMGLILDLRRALRRGAAR